MKVYQVPTGHICLINGSRNKPLEFLSIGDYGKEKNLKADFLGLHNEINGVPHTELLPLEEKWVITISSQYGCSMNCTFCDVPRVGAGINATLKDLTDQFYAAISLHPEVTHTERLNLHYARMGEPTFNREVINSAYIISDDLCLRGWGFHPVVSTMMPKNNNHLFEFLHDWLDLKNKLNGDAGLQLSINTTDLQTRNKTMPSAMPLIEISEMFSNLLSLFPSIKGRKIALNFALTDAAIDAVYLRSLFSPEYFLCKITPMHKTNAVINGNMMADNGYTHYYPYKIVEEELKAVGFDVIVFIPSEEEDSSKITCGNVALISN